MQDEIVTWILLGLLLALTLPIAIILIRAWLVWGSVIKGVDRTMRIQPTINQGDNLQIR
jgi:hypothetical protein